MGNNDLDVTETGKTNLFNVDDDKQLNPNEKSMLEEETLQYNNRKDQDDNSDLMSDKMDYSNSNFDGMTEIAMCETDMFTFNELQKLSN